MPVPMETAHSGQQVSASSYRDALDASLERAVDLHSFIADPDPDVHLNADPDPA